MENGQIVPDRAYRDDAIHRRPYGEALTPGDAVQIRRFSKDPPFQRVFNERRRVEGLLDGAKRAFVADPLEDLLIHGEAQDALLYRAHTP